MMMRFGRSVFGLLLVVAGAMLVAAGCGEGDDLDTGAASTVNEDAVPSTPAAPDPGGIAEARQRWAEVGIDTYHYEVTWSRPRS